LDLTLERILSKVQKPARYTGGEYRQIIKNKNEVDIRVAFCFPDTYEIGMSNLGLRIMYGIFNAIDKVWCERAFAPWIDMEEQMRANNIDLYALESGDSLSSFDIVAFSLGYELSYTNVLNMLDLAGIEPRSVNRPENAPLVIAGGACCFNPEPLSDFIDLFVIGEGEEVAVELTDLFIKKKSANMSKAGYLRAAAMIVGVYVPALYNIEYNSDGSIFRITKDGYSTQPVMKRIVTDLDSSYFPVDTIIASTELVHDRVVLELFRGCARGCRFCQAGHINRPVRARSSDTLIEQGIKSLQLSGFDELALLSLSSSDYAHLVELCDGLLDWCAPRYTGISLPSLRADNFSIDILERIQKVRKSGLTFAPEAGSQRLRDVINKNLTEDDLLETCKLAFEGGWNGVKLYFMLGLPTETDEDVLAIADLAHAVLDVWKQYSGSKNRAVKITVSTSCFIPKPHTPFQWEAQVSMTEYRRRVELLRNAIRSKAIKYSWHSPEQGYVEAALARGDRRMGSVIEAAWRRGARHDSWSECFKLNNWLEAFKDCEIDIDFYAVRERDEDEILPWSVVSAGLNEEHLLSERRLSREGKTTPDCRNICIGCGVCNTIPVA